nr:DUF2974 domain-containing protein [Clostridia bacterium]
MANLMDYLVWRGDLPLSAAPWNDVDSLIAATLAYQRYPDEAMLLRDAAVVLSPPPHLEINFVKEGRSLLSAAGMTERFAGILIHRAETVTDPERDMQFAAVTLTLPDGVHFIAFRGTDNTIVGWREDFNMAFESPIPAQTAAVDYLSRAAAELTGPIIVGGHSKGGNLAIYAAAHAGADVQSRIRAVYSFDGPGLDDATMASAGYAAIAPRIRAFIPQSSVVGLLLAYHPDYTVVKSDALGLLQHDTFTWQVLGTRFVEVPEVDVSSQLVNQTVHAWLSRVTPEQRRRFVDTLFDLLEATGATTMKELLTDVPGRTAGLLRGLQKVDFDTARMIITLLGDFVSIGTQNILGLLRARREEPQSAITEGEIPHD